MRSRIELSVVVLSYNTKEILVDCVESIYKHTKGVRFEVVVVDNGSSDGSVDEVQKQIASQARNDRNGKLRLVKNKSNLGFAKGNNKAKAVVQGEYVLFLNSDTLLTSNCLKKALLYIRKRPEIGALSVKQVLVNGNMDLDSRRSFPTPWVALTHFSGLDKLFPKSRLFAKYWYGYMDENKTHEIDVLQGAFFLSPKRVLDEVGWFDEDYFLNGEDIDLSWKIKSAGYKNVYWPKTSLIHLKGATKGKKSYAKKRPLLKRMKYVVAGVNAMEIFYKKRLAKDYSIGVTFLVIAGIKTIKMIRVAREIMR